MQIVQIVQILKNEFGTDEVIFNISEKSETNIYLNIIVVPFKKRKQKNGTKFMKRLIELANKNKKNIIINISDMYAEDGDPKAEDLHRWYKKLGFVETENYKYNKEMIYFNTTLSIK